MGELRQLPGALLIGLKHNWLDMLQPPWLHKGDGRRRAFVHWGTWLTGWAWTLTGVVGGALVAPSLMESAGLSDASYKDGLVIAIAAVAGFLVQLLGWVLITLVGSVGYVFVFYYRKSNCLFLFLYLLVLILLLTLPLASVGYSVYLYLAWLGSNQRIVTVAFAGVVLIKMLVIPAITSAVRSRIFRVLLDWLRGGKDTKKAG